MSEADDGGGATDLPDGDLPAGDLRAEDLRDGPAENESGRDDSVTAGTALSVFLFGEVIALGFYMYISRPMWFFLDEWDFLANRTAFNLHDVFQAHNEHWVTLPVLAYRALWFVFGLKSYRPYQLAIVLAHLATAFLLRTIMRRVGVRPWTATLVATTFVFFGSGYQDIVLPFQITLVGSVVFGLVHLILAAPPGPWGRRDYLGVVAGLAALMCSGVGVSMVIAVGVAVLISRGWRVALLHTMPLAAIYVVWFAAIGHDGYTGEHGSPIDVFQFVRMIVTATFGALGHYGVLGWALGILLVVGLVLAWRSSTPSERRMQWAAPLGLLAGAISLLCITGYGRAGLALFTEKSRYLYLLIALLLPAFAVAVDAVMLRWRRVAPVVVVLLLIGVPGNINAIINYMNRPVVQNQGMYRRMIISLPRVEAAKDVPRDTIPDQEFAHFVTIGWLLDGAASGRIPKPKHISPADEAMDTIRLSFKQLRSKVRPGDVCAGLARGDLVFHLNRGQSFVVVAQGRQEEFVPASPAPGEAYRFYPVTVAGPLFTVQRRVSFRAVDAGPGYSQVCAKEPVIRAARIAASR
jgi:hypothetical protein